MACSAGSRQPPCQLALSSALPLVAAVCSDAGMPGSFCSQRSACAASRPRSANAPPPLVGRSSPFALASTPGAVSARSPLPACALGCTSSWPRSSASSVRTRRADSTSVPPACCAFQLPLALASRRRSSLNSWVAGLFLLRGGLASAGVPAPALAFTLASKPTAVPWL